MKNVRKVQKDGWIKWEGSWYQGRSNRINDFVGQCVFVDDPLDGTLTLFTCSWLRIGIGCRQTVCADKWICEAE